ncbi:MAG: WD40 repeat domain-containing protein, partial [Pirellulaceae bacterium]
QFAGPIKAIHVLRGGRSALVTDGATLVEFDFTKAEARRQRPLARSWASGQSAAISPDGELVAIGDSYNIHVWNAETGQELPPLVGNEIAWSMAFTPDSTRLLSGGSSRVNVWEVRKARRIHAQSTAGGSTTIKALAISPDGKLYAAGGAPFDHLQVFTTPR